MSAQLSISEARASLPEVLDRVEAGEEIIITRHGRPVAVVVRPDVLGVRRGASSLAEADEVGELIAEGGRRRLVRTAGISTARGEALVAAIRADRSRR